MDKKILTYTAVSFGALMMGLTLSVSPGLSSIATGHVHNGNHYIGCEPTTESYGVKDYWICCGCHEMFFEEPSSGTWNEMGNVSDEVYSYVGLEHDSRYIEKLKIQTSIESVKVSNDLNQLITNSSPYKGNDCGLARSLDVVITTNPIDIDPSLVHWEIYSDSKMTHSLNKTLLDTGGGRF